MKSAALGSSISGPEVTNVSQHGFWLMVAAEELFLRFATFPWFKQAPIGKIVHVEQRSAQHLYWPELDIELALESIRHPERFLLVARVVGEGCAGQANGLTRLRVGERRCGKEVSV